MRKKVITYKTTETEISQAHYHYPCADYPRSYRAIDLDVVFAPTAHR